MQGTYLTLAHAHGALWGVYGILSMGLCLVILRIENATKVWSKSLLSTLETGLAVMNFGMVLQLFCSVIPVGLIQFWMAVDKGYWYARSPDFHYNPRIQQLKLGRIAGDLIFGGGLLMICWFVFRLALLKPPRVSIGRLTQPLMK